MIFSLLKIRKKTAGVLVGIMVGALSLWAIAAWQNLTLEAMLGILLGTVIMLGGIMIAAFLLSLAFKLLGKLLNRLNRQGSEPPVDEG